MKKVRIAAGMVAIAPAAIAVAAVPAAQAAGTAHQADHSPTRTGKKVALLYPHPEENLVNLPAKLWSGGNRLEASVRFGSSNYVNVTCYYSGAPSGSGHGDPYWDHYTNWIVGGVIHYQNGHVADYHVNLSGHYPWSANPRIPHC